MTTPPANDRGAPPAARGRVDQRTDRSRPTDSPWFWILTFSLVALVGLVGIAGKYDRRQAQIEGRFLGRENLAAERARRAAGLAPEDLAASADEPTMLPGERLIPLWPIAVTLAAIACGAGWGLAKGRANRALPDRATTKEPAGDQ